MTPAAREIPNIARPERIGRCSVGAQNGGAATARYDVTQFGSSRVPMEFTQRTGLQAHRGTGDVLASRELPDRCAPYETARASARRLLFQAVAEQMAELSRPYLISYRQYPRLLDFAQSRRRVCHSSRASNHRVPTKIAAIFPDSRDMRPSGVVHTNTKICWTPRDIKPKALRSKALARVPKRLIFSISWDSRLGPHRCPKAPLISMLGACRANGADPIAVAAIIAS